MSCKRWWWRGGGDQQGTSGRDWMFDGRGGNSIDARGGNDFVWAGRGRDTVDGGAGNDKVFAGSGADSGIYTVSENVGAKDYYNGGRGNDLLILRMTHAEYASAKADLLAFDAFLAEQAHSWRHHSFQFKTFDLKVKNWERYEVQLTDSEPVIKNAAPVAADDALTFDSGFAQIQEVEANDPVQGSLSAAQVIERSSFRVAPSADVGDDTLPRVSITGTIEGPLPVTGPNANDVDLFAISLQAGEKIILDIDYGFLPESQVNTQLFLMDGGGNVLLDNDNAPRDSGGSGSMDLRDAYLEFTDPGSGGTYYVAVSTWNNDPLGSSGMFSDSGYTPGDYVLNVSIDNAAADLGALVITADTLLGNDSDSDGNALVITSVSNAINGTVEMNSSGSILFKSGADSPGSFDYTISDGNGGESLATVTLNGNQIAGTASDDSLVSTPQDDLFVGGEGNDTFHFASGSGNDTIADFIPGSDALAITDAMLIGDSQTVDNGTLVNFDSGDSVLLVGVSEVGDVNDLFA